MSVQLQGRLRRLRAALICVAIAAPLALADSPAGSAVSITYSLQLPGDGPMTVDSAGNAYLIGPIAAGVPLQTTPGALYPTPASSPGTTSYLAKLDNTGKLVYLTYIIGSARRVAVDDAGNVVLAGYTPDTPGLLYVAEVDSTGTRLLCYHAFPSSWVHAGIPVLTADHHGNVYIADSSSTEPTIQ